jgi:Uma2 family endonuclease
MNASAFIKVDKATFYKFITASAQVDGRYEYVRGRIMQQMTGGTWKHSKIGGRFFVLLTNAADAALWDVNGPDRGIDTPETIRYPDVSMEPVGADPTSFATAAPALIVEVLSPTSGDRDLDVKPAEYLSLPSLRAYIVASQDEPACLVWLHDAATGKFPVEPQRVAGLDAVIDVPSLGLQIPLQAVYRGIAEKLMGIPSA